MLTCLYDVVGYALLGSMCFMCSFPCHMVRSLSSHAYYAWIHVLPWLCAKFLHVCMHVSMPRGLYLCFRMLVCLDLCSLHALCHLPCAYALHVLFICLSLDLVCHAMCYYSPFVPFIAFSYVLAKWLGLDLDPMVFVIIHTPWPISKGLDHSYFACLCLLASML